MLKITMADIGRKVRTRTSGVWEVVEVREPAYGAYPVKIRHTEGSVAIRLTVNGSYRGDGREWPLDAVDFVDEPIPTPTVTSNGLQRFELLKAVAQGLAANPSYGGHTAKKLASLACQITNAITEQENG